MTIEITRKMRCEFIPFASFGHGKPKPAQGTYPYHHRTCKEVREDEESQAIRRSLGR